MDSGLRICLAKSLNEFIRFDFSLYKWCQADAAPPFFKHAVVADADKNVGCNDEALEAPCVEDVCKRTMIC